tara:strand:+ start:1347 stop:2249 length:903 start_codon:yes stop_codon:yes gene_type:complete
MARPFLKWVGGKRQLLGELNHTISGIVSGKINYCEAFVGGGALFFHLEENGKIIDSIINDANQELILCYKVVQQDVENLIKKLRNIEKKYHALSKIEQEQFYYETRRNWNKDVDKNVQNLSTNKKCARAATTMFLNRTCFNGLFRVNSKGEFNTPIGSYSNPRICDGDNLRDASRALARTEILCGSFDQISLPSRDWLVYFDPPYRPLSTSSSFTAYHKSGFNDEDQRNLAIFVSQMVEKNLNLVVLSNSDSRDGFFESIYIGTLFELRSVSARRNINRDGKGRGEITELIIVGKNQIKG